MSAKLMEGWIQVLAVAFKKRTPPIVKLKEHLSFAMLTGSDCKKTKTNKNDIFCRFELFTLFIN